ncbi:MAG: hypothetical protein AAB522_02535, partial [Patescibacteria group bacterium]
MKSSSIVFFLFLLLIPGISFAASASSNDLLIIALLQEQIRLLQKLIEILTMQLKPAVVALALPVVPTPAVSAEEQPFV